MLVDQSRLSLGPALSVGAGGERSLGVNLVEDDARSAPIRIVRRCCRFIAFGTIRLPLVRTGRRGQSQLKPILARQRIKLGCLGPGDLTIKSRGARVPNARGLVI